MTAHSHTGPLTGHMTIASLVTALLLLLTILGHGREVGGLDRVAWIARRLLLLPEIVATLGQRWSSPLWLRVAPSLLPRPLSRTSSGCSSACWGPWRSGMRLLGLLKAAGVTSAGVLPGPAAPVTSAAPVACSSVSVPAPGVVPPAGTASATASPGRCERARESSHLERRSSGRERSRSGGKRGRGRSPSPARSARSASVTASSSESLEPEVRVSAMPPPPAGRPGVCGGRSTGDCSASGRNCSPQPGPSGLGSGERLAPNADRSCPAYSVRSSPVLSGVVEDDRDSSSGSVDLDRDDLFRAVLRLIQVLHSSGKCSPEWVQDFSCDDLRATVRAFTGFSLASFPLAVVSP